MITIYTTASTLIAMLAFIDPEQTPKIAYNDDSLAEPLRNKLKETIGDRDGSMEVTLQFTDDETDLSDQFRGCAKNINDIFEMLS